MPDVEHPAEPAAETSGRSSRGPAIAAVAVFTAAFALLLLLAAFSTDNTDWSIDGTTATSSGAIDE